MPWLVAACLVATLALTPLAACGMSVGDEQSTWGGQGPAPLVETPTAESSGDGKAP